MASRRPRELREGGRLARRAPFTAFYWGGVTAILLGVTGCPHRLAPGNTDRGAAPSDPRSSIPGSEAQAAPPPPLQASPQILRVPVHTLFFAAHSAELDLNGQALLDGVAEVMHAEPARRLRVEGHTDGETEGTPSPALAYQRAQAVVTYLSHQHGLSGERFEIEAIGSGRPWAPPGVPLGTSRNRRVEFWWLPE